MSMKRVRYAVLYTAGGQVEKIAFTDGGEALHVLLRKEIQELDETLNKWAEQGEFSHYELGES